jgi:hypothetical protein
LKNQKEDFLKEAKVEAKELTNKFLIEKSERTIFKSSKTGG